MINPMALLKMKPLFQQFREHHPKFVEFLGYAPQHLGEECLLEVSITQPDGEKAVTNIRISQEDLELVGQLKELLGANQ